MYITLFQYIGIKSWCYTFTTMIYSNNQIKFLDSATYMENI